MISLYFSEFSNGFETLGSVGEGSSRTDADSSHG
jgi:hypothetical protein